MIRRLPALLGVALAALALVPLLEAAASDAHPYPDVPFDDGAPAYVADEGLRADDTHANEDGPTLIGSASPRPETPGRELHDDERRALIEAALQRSVTLHVHRPGLGTLISADGGSPALTPEERAFVERILRALADRLAELANTPNDAGWTVASPGPGGGHDGAGVVLHTPVPGTGETYAQAAERMVRRAVSEILDRIAPATREAWREAADRVIEAGPLFDVPRRILAPGRAAGTLRIGRKRIETLALGWRTEQAAR